jgi:hypothetical protein
VTDKGDVADLVRLVHPWLLSSEGWSGERIGPHKGGG